jgi:malonyl-CoA/methylmalonyl-CoA synthetase
MRPVGTVGRIVLQREDALLRPASRAWWSDNGSMPPDVHLPPRLQHRSLDLLRDRSLPGRWLRRWAEIGSGEQLRSPGGEWLTGGELEERTRRKASQLLHCGLVQGDRFVICARSSVELVIAYVAALRSGLVVIPLNPAYTEPEVTRIVVDAQPRGAAVEDDKHASWIRAASAGTTVHGIELDLPAHAPEAQIDQRRSGDPALLIYTSGTTGRAKGALLTHGNLLASASAVNVAWRWEPGDCLLLTLPLFHMHGLGVGLNGSLCAGARINLRPEFDAADVQAEAARAETTMFFGVPAMYQRLAAAGALEQLRRLRLLVSGSAPLPAALAAEIADGTGQVPLERYGMTETVMLTSNPYEGERRPGTVGFPLPGVEVRLARESHEVEVRGPNVIERYYRNPEATADSFTSDGWFRTGDLGEFDEDGYLRLVGRSKELIITGGYNVYPREVEEAILTHSAVTEVAVIGRPSERWGEEVTAVVVAATEIDPDELRAHAARQLAPYKVPKRIEFTDALPRNALGKVIRGEL